MPTDRDLGDNAGVRPGLLPLPGLSEAKRHPLELTTLEAEKLIHDVADLKPPIFILTGGDPLKRPDIFYLVRRAVAHGLNPAMTPSATPLLTREAIADLKRARLSRLAVSLDGSVPELHDAFRGVNGSYERTLNAIHWANEFGLPIQVNTSISRRNIHDLENMARLLKNFKLVLWSAFFLVPTGRAQMDDLLSADEVENAFAILYRFSKELPFKVKTTEAQHYRRYIIQQRIKNKGRGTVEISGQAGKRPFRGSCPSMTVKGSFLCRTPEMSAPAGSCPFQPATSAYGAWEIFTANLRSWSLCVTPPTCRASAASVSSRKSAVDHVPVPTRLRETCSRKIPAATTYPGVCAKPKTRRLRCLCRKGSCPWRLLQQNSF